MAIGIRFLRSFPRFTIVRRRSRRREFNDDLLIPVTELRGDGVVKPVPMCEVAPFKAARFLREARQVIGPVPQNSQDFPVRVRLF